LLQPRRTKYAKAFYMVSFPKARAPEEYETIYVNRSYRVLASPACLARLDQA